MPTLKGLKKQCKYITSKVRHCTPYNRDYYKLIRIPADGSYGIEYDGGIIDFFDTLEEVQAFLKGIELALDLYLEK